MPKHCIRGSVSLVNISHTLVFPMYVQCTRIETELGLYKDAVPLTQACELIVSHIEKSQEPFGAKAAGESNAYHSGAGGGGGCTIA